MSSPSSYVDSVFITGEVGGSKSTSSNGERFDVLELAYCSRR